jgi:hypothetical protein
MRLKNCLEIGLDCSMETIGESVFNIDMHSIQLFEYSKINQELTELFKEADDLYSKTNFTKDSSIEEVLDWINKNNYEETKVSK